MEKQTLTTDEAAKLLCISVHTLRAWLAKNQNGIMEVAHKVGWRWLFFQDELIDWIKQHRGEKCDENEPYKGNAPD